MGCFNEFRLDAWNKYELSELAFQAERIAMSISGGWQDQYATVFGGVNFIEFSSEKNIIFPLRLTEKINLELQENLFLFKVSNGRNSGSIHKDQKETMKNSRIKSLVEKNVKHCYKMKEYLLTDQINQFGSGLDIAWSLKREFSQKISNSEIDEIYEYAIENGASGGKLLGAGGGGFFLFFVTFPFRNSFLRAMAKRGMDHTPFQFDHQGMVSWTNRERTL